MVVLFIFIAYIQWAIVEGVETCNHWTRFTRWRRGELLFFPRVIGSKHIILSEMGKRQMVSLQLGCTSGSVCNWGIPTKNYPKCDTAGGHCLRGIYPNYIDKRIKHHQASPTSQTKLEPCRCQIETNLMQANVLATKMWMNQRKSLPRRRWISAGRR